MRNSAGTLTVNRSFDPVTVREDFPILEQLVYGHPLVYFDNAATTQKPTAVINSLSVYYSTYNANIHRGVHYLSQKASSAYDNVRERVRDFINADEEREIIFVRGTTEAINLVATSYGTFIGKDDIVLVSAMEHHSNIVPWQLLCERKGAKLQVIPMTNSGELIMEEFTRMLSPAVKFISVAHTSNSLGTVNPVKEIIRQAKTLGIPVLVDAAQAMVHEKIDVRELGCDFLAFSGHKMLGPTGIGVLYGRQQLLEKMPPYQGGGEMISSVTFEKTEYNELPFKFEAGTPDIAGVIGLGAAIGYLNGMDREGALRHEQELLRYATERVSEVPGVRLIGTAEKKSSVLSFVIDGLNALDVGMYLDTKGIAVRTGHHCTEPVMTRLCIPGTIRASLLFYNTKEEIDRMIDGLHGAVKLLQVK